MFVDVYGLYHCMNAKGSAFQHIGLTLESGHIELATSESLDCSFMEICWFVLIFASPLEQLTCLLGYQGTTEVCRWAVVRLHWRFLSHSQG